MGTNDKVQALLAQAKQAFRQLTETARSAIAEKAEVKRRQAICQACPFFAPTLSRCSKCGCFINVKSTLQSAGCPIGRW